MGLEDNLQLQRQRAWDQRTPQEREVRAAAIAAVADSGLARNALGEGEAVPLFALSDASGRLVRVSDLLASGPMVLTFYRGGWCPYCNLELRALQARLADISALGASLVAVSPELPDRSLSVMEKNALAFPVLSDQGNAVAQQFRLVHRIDPSVVAYQRRNGNDVAAYNGADIPEVPLPATYVIDRRGVARFAFVCADYTRRADPDEVVQALGRLGQADETRLAGVRFWSDRDK